MSLAESQEEAGTRLFTPTTSNLPGTAWNHATKTVKPTASPAACGRPMAAIAGFSCGACPCAMPRDESSSGSARAPISTS